MHVLVDLIISRPHYKSTSILIPYSIYACISRPHVLVDLIISQPLF